MSLLDLERAATASKMNKVELGDEESIIETGMGENVTMCNTFLGRLSHAARELELYGFESRGIERVDHKDRAPQSWFDLCLIWCVNCCSFVLRFYGYISVASKQTSDTCPRTSAGLTLSNLCVGLIGPALFNLSLPETLRVVWGGCALGSLCSVYLACFGKRNGLQALVSSRFVFGWYGSMIMALLNGFTTISYGILDSILGA